MRRGLGLVMGFGLFTSAWAVDVPGTLQWSQRVALSSPVSGVVRSVHAGVGDHVKKGQVLLTLDAGAAHASVSESHAEVARLKEEEQDAKRNLDRVQELYNRTVISTSELEQAQTRHVRAKAGLNETRARLTRAQKLLSDATLRAPFDALVVVRQVEPGQTVASPFQPQTLLVLARANEMIARAKVSLAQVEKMKAGESVTVQVGQQTYMGKVQTLGLEPVGEKEEAGYLLDVLFTVNGVLRAGTPAVLKLR